MKENEIFDVVSLLASADLVMRYLEVVDSGNGVLTIQPMAKNKQPSKEEFEVLCKRIKLIYDFKQKLKGLK